MKRFEIEIDGMGCQHCIDGVTAALQAAGALVVSVVIGKAVTEFDGDVTVLKEAIEDRGFDVKGITEK